MTVIVLYAYPPGLDLRPAVERHLHALDGLGLELLYHNAMEGSPRALSRVRPDAVVLHTTFLCLRWFEDYERHRLRFAWLSALDCPKLALPQDEYDHSEVLEEWLLEVGVTHVYSNFEAAVREPVYPLLAAEAEFREVLTGYVDEDVVERLRAQARPLHERPYDIVYRATQLPYWFGSHGQLKHRIGAVVDERAAAHGMATDISTRPEDTILGGAWWDFLGSGRVVIGCESGSSVLDRRGEIQGRIRRLLAFDPSLTFEEIAGRMPEGWDSWMFFAISPRHFEAVITRTAQVLVEGSYSGILQPERHYLSLRRDLANLDEVLERIRDVDLLEQLTEQAYEDLVTRGAHTYARFAQRLREDIEPTGRLSLAGQTQLDGTPARLATRLSRAPSARTRSLASAAVAAIGLLRRSPGARRLLRTQAVRKRLVSPKALIGDFVELERLSRAAARSGAAISVGHDREPATVLITTGPGDPVEESSVDELGAAVHSGAALVWLHGSGAAGPRRFDALSSLAARHPGEVAGLLAEVVGTDAYAALTTRR